ncbi:hypothetical protein ACWDZ8_37645 [Streptomyces sp. NPDC003233]
MPGLGTGAGRRDRMPCRGGYDDDGNLVREVTVGTHRPTVTTATPGCGGPAYQG